MKYLFVHQNFPGQFLHIVRHLLASDEHDVVFICQQNANFISGVRRVIYQVAPRAESIHPHAREYELAMARAEAVQRAARQVKALGFEPDIIIGHHGWGELLSFGEVWPQAPLLGYHEYYYNLVGHDVGFDPEFPVSEGAYPHIRAKNGINLLTLTNPGYGITPTRYQLETYPEWARGSITLLPEGVNLETCTPSTGRRTNTVIGGIAIKASEKLVTYVARDLEPYRGFHILMRAIPAMLKARPDLRIVMVGGDSVSYGMPPVDGTWRERLMTELGKKIDLSRVHFPGRMEYLQYIKLLQRSDAHVYLTYPFVASWSLREAMACGCAIVASETAPVQEFITHGETGVLTPFLNVKALANCILRVLEGGPEIKRMRAAARKFAETNLRMDAYLKNFEALIDKIIKNHPAAQTVDAAPAPPTPRAARAKR
jgi:glycosyltransferase involved in cell wall biosynthesis